MEARDRKGKLEPASREECYLNIRNAIAKASGLTSIAKTCKSELIFSEDAVGMLLFSWMDVSLRLVSTKEAGVFLRQNNISLSTINDEVNEQRAVRIGATLQAHTGRLICYYLTITDSRFPDTFKRIDPTVRKPVTFLADPDVSFYVIIRHPDVTYTVLEEYIGKLITHPAIFEVQEEIIQREIAGEEETVQYGSQSQPSQPNVNSDTTTRKTEEGILNFIYFRFFECNEHAIKL
jgi:hypothetical protein